MVCCVVLFTNSVGGLLRELIIPNFDRVGIVFVVLLVSACVGLFRYHWRRRRGLLPSYNRGGGGSLPPYGQLPAPGAGGTQLASSWTAAVPLPDHDQHLSIARRLNDFQLYQKYRTIPTSSLLPFTLAPFNRRIYGWHRPDFYLGSIFSVAVLHHLFLS